jgi:hypothetical protein
MGQSASFTPRTLTLGAMSTGVKQSNSSWNSQRNGQVSMPPSLTIGHESTARTGLSGLSGLSRLFRLSGLFGSFRSPGR